MGMKEELKNALEAVKTGNFDAAESAVAGLKQLSRRENGLFELTEVDDNLFQAARLVYPVYAAYETECNKKEGYPDLLAQLRTLRKELKREKSLTETAAFLDALICTLDFVSPQLYEYYRELEELFRDTVRETIQVFYHDGHFREADDGENREAEQLLKTAIAHASELQVLLGEKYERFSDMCTGGNGVSEGEAVPDSGRVSADEGGESGTEIRLVCQTARNAVIEIAAS